MTCEEARALLGVEPDVSAEQLRRAYLRAVRRHPPEGDPVAFQRVRAAYELLSETTKAPLGGGASARDATAEREEAATADITSESDDTAGFVWTEVFAADLDLQAFEAALLEVVYASSEVDAEPVTAALAALRGVDAVAIPWPLVVEAVLALLERRARAEAEVLAGAVRDAAAAPGEGGAGDGLAVGGVEWCATCELLALADAVVPERLASAAAAVRAGRYGDAGRLCLFGVEQAAGGGALIARAPLLWRARSESHGFAREAERRKTRRELLSGLVGLGLMLLYGLFTSLGRGPVHSLPLMSPGAERAEVRDDRQRLLVRLASLAQHCDPADGRGDVCRALIVGREALAQRRCRVALAGIERAVVASDHLPEPPALSPGIRRFLADLANHCDAYPPKALPPPVTKLPPIPAPATLPATSASPP